MESLYFTFNNIQSSDMDQYLIRTQGGAVSSPFFGGQTVKEDTVPGRLTPYHMGIERQPIEFTIEISPLDQKWTPQRRNEIGRWLVHETYKPFQTADDMGKIYYAIVTEAPNFELYNNKGFIPITFKTNSAYAWSTVYIDTFDLSNNASTRIVELKNMSNINKNYFPKIQVELATGVTGFSIKNLSNAGKTMVFTGLYSGETVSIDNENEIILSNMPLSRPFEKFSGHWLELVYGINRIEVTGKCKILTKMQFPILQ